MRAAVFMLVLGVAIAAAASEVSSQKIDELFSAYIKPGSPGCSLGVVRDGKFLYRKSYGEASLELGVPLSPQSVFYLASVSKQFTAASVVLAAQQGYLSLDDDVRRYIPELPDYGHPITLRQMLHHTSGLRDYLSLVYLSGGNIAELSSPGEVLKLIARQKGLNNVPGDAFNYSNSNYFLLGAVIQRATRKSLAEFAAQNIFQPLGMTHTRYYDDNSVVVPNRVAAYDPAEEGRFAVDWSTTFDMVGSGGVMSTVDDLLLWNNNFYANKLGKGTLVQELETRGVLNNGKPINYGLGLWLGQYRGKAVIEHSGGTFGYRTELLRFPQQRLGVILLCNVANANVETRARQVADLFLGGELQPESVSAAGANYPDPSPYAGTYVDPHTYNVYTFTAKDGQLMAWGSALRRFGPNQFYDLVGNPLTFENRDGVMTARLDLDGEPYFEGRRVRETRPSAAELSAFAGDYRSDELEANYSLTVKDAELTLKVGERAPVTLKPLAASQFQAGDLGMIVFNPSGKVFEFKLYEQSAQGIEFQKVKAAAASARR